MKLKQWLQWSFFSMFLYCFIQGQAYAATADGVWQTFNADNVPTSLTRISTDGGQLTGTIEKVLPINGVVKETCDKCSGDRAGKPLVGMTIAWGFQDAGNGKWTNGHVLEVRTGKIRDASIQVSPDGQTLDLTASAGILSRTVQWTKVK